MHSLHLTAVNPGGSCKLELPLWLSSISKCCQTAVHFTRISYENVHNIGCVLGRVICSVFSAVRWLPACIEGKIEKKERSKSKKKKKNAKFCTVIWNAAPFYRFIVCYMDRVAPWREETQNEKDKDKKESRCDPIRNAVLIPWFYTRVYFVWKSRRTISAIKLQ